MRVSYTQLSTYQQCPRKFKFYIDKAPQDPSRTKALRFGSAVHKALEFAYADRYQPPSRERVLRYFRKLAEVEFDPEVVAMFQKGEDALARYLDAHGAESVRVVAIEQKFSMDLSDQHQMVGVVDRLDMLPDGSFEILDYKTGRIPDARKLDENWQLAIYQMVKEQQLQTSRITVSLVYIMYDGHKLTYQFAKDELSRVREQILGQIAVMERDTLFQPRVSSWCATCAYQPLCPAWTHKDVARNVVIGKERDRELRDIQERVDRLLALTAKIKHLEVETEALKAALAEYARGHNASRLFSDLGTVSFSFRTKSAYNVAQLVEILRLELLRKVVKTIDARKLEKALPYLTEEERARVEAARTESASTTVTARPRFSGETEGYLTT